METSRESSSSIAPSPSLPPSAHRLSSSGAPSSPPPPADPNDERPIHGSAAAASPAATPARDPNDDRPIRGAGRPAAAPATSENPPRGTTASGAPTDPNDERPIGGSRARTAAAAAAATANESTGEDGTAATAVPPSRSPPLPALRRRAAATESVANEGEAVPPGESRQSRRSGLGVASGPRPSSQQQADSMTRPSQVGVLARSCFFLSTTLSSVAPPHAPLRGGGVFSVDNMASALPPPPLSPLPLPSPG